MDMLLVSRSRHNASQSILKLPPELLYLIIRHLRIRVIYLPVGMSDTYRFDSPPDESIQNDSLGWVYITHVCRQLRDVALSFGELWSDIRCEARCTMWLSEWLRRSAGMPISLTLLLWNLSREDDQTISDVFTETPEYLTRIRSLEIEFTAPDSVRGDSLRRSQCYPQ